jgi:hypothetical protein
MASVQCTFYFFCFNVADSLPCADRLVWHQGNPITAGTRWVIVIFYAVVFVCVFFAW